MVRAPWERFLLAGLVATLIATLLGPLALAIEVQLIGWAAVVLTVRRTRILPRARRRPWLCFAGSATLFLSAALARGVHGEIAGDPFLFPSAGDAIYLAGYVLLIIGAVLLVRVRGSDGNLDDLVDALMVAAAAALLVWAFVMAPYVRDGAFPIDERILNTVYTTLSLIMIAVVARLAVGPGMRVASYYFLAGAAGLILLTDVVATLESTDALGEGRLSLIAGPLTFLLAGSAVLHPSMEHLTARPLHHEVQLTRRRQAMLAVLLMIAPAVLAFQISRNEEIDLPVVVVGSVTLSLLVLVRLSGLVRTREQAVERERILNRAGNAFVGATSPEEMYDRALHAVLAFAGSSSVVRASILSDADGDDPMIVAAVGRASEQAVGVVPARGRLHPEVHVALSQRRVVVTSDRPPIDLPCEKPERAVTVIPLVRQNEARSAILVSSPQPLPRAAVAGLEALSSELSLAIDSALLNEERHRQASEKRFRALIENANDLVMVVGPEGLVTFCSPAAERLLGLPDIWFVGRAPFERVHDDDQWRVPPLLDHPAPPRGPAEALELRLAHADRAYRWFEVLTKDLRDDPSVGGIVVNAREITDRKRAEQRLARSEARFRVLVQNSSDVVAVVDATGVFTYVSPAVTTVLGYRADDLVGTNCLDLVPPEVANSVRAHPDLLELDPFPQTSIEVHLLDSHGEARTMDVTIADLRREPAVGGIVLNARDVSVRKELEYDLRHQALHDALTGLGNRALFTQSVTDALEKTRDGARVGVLFVDLDDFKTVNDSLGHAAGDQLLVAVAGRLQECLRVSDLAARLGGDEFGILLPASYGESEAQGVADRVLEALRKPLDIQGRSINLTASLGIALGAPGEGTGEVLLRNADVAMYLAKGRGKNRYEMFREEMHTNVFERLEMKADLSRAIDDNQLVLHYQPIVDLATGRIDKVEALVRWRHPERGFLSPVNFIPLAEETGLIVPLGRWVLNEAVSQLKRWMALPAAAELFVAVNLSVRQLQQDGIVQEVLGVLDRNRVPPDRLIVEVTESMLVEDASDAAQRIDALRATGVALAVDDFGTGYSSLGTVQRFGVDYIKIDRSFVEPLGAVGEPDVVRTIIDLAGRLGARTVAEGIESNAQLVQLRELGCDLGQGFYFAEPLTPEAFEHLMVPDEATDVVLLPEPG